jgi:hypothetical protein
VDNSILEIVKRNQFLPPHEVENKNPKFQGTDTEETFNKHLETQPNDWYYRTASVHYTLNQHGYRTEEFDNIDWANSIVIFGCSMVFGVGVDDQYTMSKQLYNLTGIPVVNMGVGGSSMTYSLHNAVILRERYPKPLAVINVWSQHDRTVYYHENKCASHGSWTLHRSNFFKEWMLNDSHSRTHAIFASKTSKLLWENTKYLECSFFKDTAELLNCPWIKWKIDARDRNHPGITSHHDMAVFLAEQLKL